MYLKKMESVQIEPSEVQFMYVKKPVPITIKERSYY